MSQRFSNSVVLTVDTPGVSSVPSSSMIHNLTLIQHTSFAATSECTALTVRAYFQNGTLPRPGTICGIESTLFGNATALGMTRRDQGVSAALKTLRGSMKIPRLGRF
jgi:hypothetical protein